MNATTAKRKKGAGGVEVLQVRVPPEDGTVRLRFSHFLILIVVCLAAYWNIQHNQFVWDDTMQIQRNLLIRDWHNIPRAFREPFWGFMASGEAVFSNYYRPLHSLIDISGYKLFGLEPVGFHWFNILFHIGCTLLVYLIFLRLLGTATPALVGGLAFALHPIHTESVAWIAGITDPLCGFFLFLSFYLYITIFPPQLDHLSFAGTSSEWTGASAWRSAGVLSTFLLALFSKEVALVFPLALVLYHLTLSPWKKVLTRRGLFLSAGVLVVLGVYLALRTRAVGGFAPATNGYVLGAYSYALTLLVLTATYWGKLILPTHLSLYHEFYPPTTLRNGTTFLASTVVLVLVAAMLVCLYKRRFGRLVFSLGWVFLFLLPVLYIKAVGFSILSERYLYIPSLGFCLLLAVVFAWWEQLSERKNGLWGRALAWVAVLALLSSYSFLTIRRNRDWKDEFTLYSRTLEEAPHAALFHNALAHLYVNRNGDLQSALREHLAALEADRHAFRSDPAQVADATAGIGTIYLMQGDAQKARQYYLQALAQYPQHDALLNMGVISWREGRLDEALSFFQQSLRTFPIYQRAYNNIGAVYLAKKDYARAEVAFRTAVELDPDYIDAHKNLATLYLQQNHPQLALEQYQIILRIDPGNANAAQAMSGVQRMLISGEH